MYLQLTQDTVVVALGGKTAGGVQENPLQGIFEMVSVLTGVVTWVYNTLKINIHNWLMVRNQKVTAWGKEKGKGNGKEAWRNLFLGSGNALNLG